MQQHTQQHIKPNYPTITSLDVDTLPAGEHRFWFQVSTNAMGVGIQLPVIVIKGEKPGAKFMITAGVHGDELNGILTAHKLVRKLEHNVDAGVVTIVPSVNIPGILSHSRDFSSSDPDASPANLNRFFQEKLMVMRQINISTVFGINCLSQMLSLPLICILKHVAQRILYMFLLILDWSLRLRWRD
ncbi:predicted deacylase [Vibrio maritimus]|uniref:Predicted deacylase n=1 Tax=Vibrio maritimus TaxID=990268 RepID=A0A090U0V5_9VIBR|nr:predicted deacylase [Vibrio maritimus]